MALDRRDFLVDAVYLIFIEWKCEAFFAALTAASNVKKMLWPEGFRSKPNAPAVLHGPPGSESC